MDYVMTNILVLGIKFLHIHYSEFQIAEKNAAPEGMVSSHAV